MLVEVRVKVFYFSLSSKSLTGFKLRIATRITVLSCSISNNLAYVMNCNVYKA